MSDMFINNVSLIYSDDEGVEIYKVNYSNMPTLSYVMYDDDELSISFDFVSLINWEGKLEEFNDILNSDDIDDFLIKATKKAIVRVQEQYEKGVSERDPDLAFLYHNKRDLASQICVALDNDIFDDLVMYDYICKSYSVIECGTSYSKLFDMLQELKEGDYSTEITAKIVDSLSDKVKNGYIEVYRGVNDKNREDGLSYTFSLKVAKFFANRWSSEGVVKKYRVHIDDVVAYITDRGEDEILTNNAKYICTVDI